MVKLQVRNYYCLVTGLPELIFGQSKLPFGLGEFLAELDSALLPHHREMANLLLLPRDNQNLLRLAEQREGKWAPLACFGEEEMRQMLKEGAGLPEYMHEFYQAHKANTPIKAGQSWDTQLARLYFDYALEQSQGFLHQWFTLERSLRNVLAAWNLREYKLQCQEPFVGDEELAAALSKSRARDFGLGQALPYLDKLLPILERGNALESEMAIDRVKWQFIDTQTLFDYFSIETVLGYMLQLQMLERWLQLDAQRGKQRLQAHLDEIAQKIQPS